VPRFTIIEERDYKGRLSEGSQKWIDAPDLNEAFAIYTARHGEPSSKHLIVDGTGVLVTYEVENGNNPYTLHLTVIEGGLA
jgi:hypothetical protein